MFLALRELKHAKFRYILIGIIMILISSLIFIITALAQGLSSDNASAIENLQADYLIMDQDAELNITKSFIPYENMTDIAKLDGIEAIAPISIQMMNGTVNDTEQNEDIAMFFTDTNGMLVPEVIEGSAGDEAFEVTADASLKREGVEVGDTLTFSDDSVYTITGFAQSHRYSHTPVLFIKGEQPESINGFAIQADKEKISNIKETLGSSYDIVTKEESLQGIPSYPQEQASLNMMIFFLFIIAAFVLAVFFYVITLQKREQFGVLKALGTKTSYLILNLIGQVAMVAVIGIAIGAGLTISMSFIMPESMPFQLEAAQIAKTSIIILIVSIVGAVISFVQVVKVDPLEAIEGGSH